MTTSQNPQVPSVTSSVFTPDQLIAGDAKIVTDTAIFLAGQAYKRGMLMGKITLGSATAAAKAGGNTGTGTLVMDATAPVQGHAKPGIYSVRCVEAVADKGTFEVKDQNGAVIEAELYSSLAGTTFSDQIKFVITTVTGHDFIVGDGFDITVAAGSGKLTKAVKTATDGSAVPHSIAVDDVDATLADKNGGVYVAGEFNQNAIILDASFAIADVKDDLRLRGIWLKPSLGAADPS